MTVMPMRLGLGGPNDLLHGDDSHNAQQTSNWWDLVTNVVLYLSGGLNNDRA